MTDERRGADVTARASSELAPRRSSVPPRAAAAPVGHWSKRRGVLAVFAAFAALGFVAANAGPSGMAFATAEDDTPEPVSLYASSIVDAQSLVIDTDAEPVAFDPDRGGYEVYVKPKPTPVVASSGGGGGAAAPLFYSGGGSPAEWMSAAGIPESDWGYVDYVVSRESGWNPNATNRRSGACGLVQALPCSKVPGSGYNPVDNLRWANGYAVGRYGSWAGAYNFWVNNHWW
ncbi:transglycosylase SLT domain-containing protein [Microbacterium schleiferi]|uniref:aggregation-promoting factor C-terminal-like domain-containing protein n=1 Tax=Microbacterium schleiferi TaxID=69362 RepID=UPI001D172F23|nr:transglycosylase SLT domain-containing protein [Microbacterium schleiferi]MCC4267732.1 transglycosylase SLT domain-containing protein [Microbacterium schleiferi]